MDKKSAIDTGRRIDINHTPKTIRSRPHKKVLEHDKPSQTDEIISDNNQDISHDNKLKDNVIAAEIAKPDDNNKRPIYVEPLEFDEEGDFLALLNDSDQQDHKVDVHIGDKVNGKIIHIGKDYAFIALSPKTEAMMAVTELSDHDGSISVKLGQKITGFVVSVRDGILLSKQVAKADSHLLQEAYEQKIPVQGKVVSINKGGFAIDIAGQKAFCPLGQIDSKFNEDSESFIGQNLSFIIERMEEHNIVLSRKTLLLKEQREQAKLNLSNLEIGKTYEATITKVADYGALADIGGLIGLIPKKEIALGHIDKVADVLKSGDKVVVKLLSYDIDQDHPEKTRLSFSLKQMQADPFLVHGDKLKAGSSLEGKVVRLENFGAFVELFPGIDGLIHISEMANHKVTHPQEILRVGSPVTVRIISFDDITKRLALSLREEVVKSKEENMQVKLERGHKTHGVVSRIERYGLFLKLDHGQALLPISEVDIPKGSDLHRLYHIGDSLDVVVIDIDDNNRIKVSSLARKAMEERDNYLSLKTEKNSFGTLADILKKAKK